MSTPETPTAGQDDETNTASYIYRITTERDDLASQLAQAQSEVKGYEHKLIADGEEIDALKQQLAALRAKRDGQKQIHEDSITRLDRKLRDEENEAQRLRGELKKWHSRAKSAEDERGRLEKSDSFCREELQRATNTIESLIQQCDRLRTENEGSKRVIAAIARQKAGRYVPWRFAGGVADCKHGYGEGINCPKCDGELIDAAIDAARKEVAKVNEFRERAYHQLDDMHSELASARAECAELEKRVSELLFGEGEALKEARAECERLREWKAEQLAVESEWNPQAVAKLLGITPGKSIRREIQPAIDRLRAENAELVKFAEEVREFVARYSPSSLSFSVLATKADAALAKHQPPLVNEK